MDNPLNPVELRVLGALIEKESTTPEYYPMSLNALVAACNQKTNRWPVTEYTEGDVHGGARRSEGARIRRRHHRRQPGDEIRPALHREDSISAAGKRPFSAF